MTRYEELDGACVVLRDQLDCDKNPGMIGSPTEVVLQAAADIEELKKDRDRWRVQAFNNTAKGLSDVAALTVELGEVESLKDRLANLLTLTANALKGRPPGDSLWSWHDLPEIAARLKEMENNSISKDQKEDL